MRKSAPSIAVFDLGGVLLDWDPRLLYRKLFNGDDAAMDDFLRNVCSRGWHDNHDRGVGFAENAAPLIARYPDKAPLIRAWGERFNEMFLGAIQGTVDILRELRARGTPLYALSNLSAEWYPTLMKNFGFLSWFDGIVVSGIEKIMKPEPQIYRILMERYAIDPRLAVFVDDVEANVEAAQRLGFTGIRFVSPEDLRKRLMSDNML